MIVICEDVMDICMVLSVLFIAGDEGLTKGTRKTDGQRGEIS